MLIHKQPPAKKVFLNNFDSNWISLPLGGPADNCTRTH